MLWLCSTDFALQHRFRSAALASSAKIAKTQAEAVCVCSAQLSSSSEQPGIVTFTAEVFFLAGYNKSENYCINTHTG
jgi:hypothetical protein